MTRDELVRRLRRVARARGVAFDVDTGRGKGSHAVIRLGDRRAVVPRGELKRGTLRGILRQLGVDEEAL